MSAEEARPLSPEPSGAAGDSGASGPVLPLPVRAEWVRERLRVPELERLLGGPIGARLDDNFESLRVRLQKAVDRIGEEARGASGEVRRRAALYRLSGLASAVIGFAAMAVALFSPSLRLPALLIGLAEGAMVVFFANLQRRLVRDLIAVETLETRFRPPLEAARTPADLHRLTERIRADMEEMLKG